MSTILMALALGAFSMIIVFFSGLASGVVRLGTLSLRSLIAFCITSVITYLVMFAFELYDAKRRQEADKIAKELAADSDTAVTDAGNFQPINPTDIPRA